mmetsp:Transcript_5868/g.22267  ORF Transcript_5868/g.22267 Transcript_5868/m.22267 type:complete len:217 (-) Transcript_5868:277-927(-)
MFSSFLLDRNRTIKKNKKGLSPDALRNQSKHTLPGSETLPLIVKKPDSDSLNQWLAVQTIEFYNITNLLYGCITEYCNEDKKDQRGRCDVMTAGKWEYQWKESGKKVVRVTAQKYVTNLMDWIAKLINDEETFPGPDGGEFPKDFQNTVKKIFTRLFRVYAHVYYSHFDEVKQLGLEKHLNTAFRHFMLVVEEFQLIDKKDLKPLERTIEKLLPRD